MKEDLETLVTIILAWVIGLVGGAAMCVVLGLAARLAWIPITFGWNLI